MRDIVLVDQHEAGRCRRPVALVDPAEAAFVEVVAGQHVDDAVVRAARDRDADQAREQRQRLADGRHAAGDAPRRIERARPAIDVEADCRPTPLRIRLPAGDICRRSSTRTTLVGT